MTSQQAAVHMDNEARAQNIHKTQLSPTDKQVKLLRRSGFSDRIIEGINNEEVRVKQGTACCHHDVRMSQTHHLLMYMALRRF
jgi:hypothetical protein